MSKSQSTEHNPNSLLIDEISSKFGIKLNRQRRLILQVLCQSDDHPDVEEIYFRAIKIDSNISIATIYRNISLLESCGAIKKLEMDVGGKSKAHYELNDDEDGDHHHLIDLKNHKIIEFSLFDKEIKEICKMIGEKTGYHIKNHKFVLYGEPIYQSDDQQNSKKR